MTSTIRNLPSIVASGKDNFWIWRKWSDGTAECWGTWGGTLNHYATIGTFYGYYTNVSFPSGLFALRPTLTYNCAVGSSFSISAGNMNITATSANVYAMSNSSGAQSVLFDMYVKGRWKV